MKKILNIYSYVKHHGLRWILFRLKYEFRKRSGWFDRKNRKIIQNANSVEFKFKLNLPEIINRDYPGDPRLLEYANAAIKGKILAFSNEYLDYTHGSDCIDWHYNPLLDKNSPRDINWNQLPDFGEYGDIKQIWEASRFPQIYFFINAFAYSKDRKYADCCLVQISDWIDNNPFPKGVNYKCGQEIAFRIFAWLTALCYFRDFCTEVFLTKVLKNIYTSLLRIDMNIDYAAESVRNNHSISESAGLLIGGLIFSDFPKSKCFIDKGLRYLEKELAYQVYSDGSYIQHSMIYHRLVLDVLSFTINIADKCNYPLPEKIMQSHRRMLDFLYSVCNDSGKVPNYGCNDGSRIFPVAGSDYRDYRESLNFAAAAQYGKYLFEKSNFTSIFFNLRADKRLHLERLKEFNDGGYYVLGNQTEDIFVLTRCHSYRHRPGQSDMFHLDVWHQGENVFCDSGTYSYNSPSGIEVEFSSTAAHNTVELNGCCQMKKVSKFGFSNWTISKLNAFDSEIFDGEHYGYLEDFEVVHRRIVNCFDNYITVKDIFKGVKEPLDFRQNWNSQLNLVPDGSGAFKAGNYKISSDFPGEVENCKVSEYYNKYEDASRLVFKARSDKDFEINTRIDFS